MVAENYNRIYDDPDMALDLYTRQCSLGVTALQPFCCSRNYRQWRCEPGDQERSFRCQPGS